MFHVKHRPAPARAARRVFASDRLPLAERYAALLADRGRRPRPDRAPRGAAAVGAAPAQLRGARRRSCPEGAAVARPRLRRRPARAGAGDRPARPARSRWSSRCCAGRRSSTRSCRAGARATVDGGPRPGRGAARDRRVRRGDRAGRGAPGPAARLALPLVAPSGALLAMKGPRPRGDRGGDADAAPLACAAPVVVELGAGVVDRPPGGPGGLAGPGPDRLARRRHERRQGRELRSSARRATSTGSVPTGLGAAGRPIRTPVFHRSGVAR